jgi:RNA-directed DNA polymerase
MADYFTFATKLATLSQAWQRIRANGLRSKSADTRAAIATFEANEGRNLRRLQNRLRSDSFSFDAQIGVTIAKASGGKRGIVMASVQNRVVERALLDTLLFKSRFVQDAIDFEFSVGGVPHRSVPHALQIIDRCFRERKNAFVRSDIKSFFDNINRQTVLKKIADQVCDDRFNKLFSSATKVILANEQNLGDDRQLFPVDEIGVAQGSPLSPLLGNILLSEFDLRMNDRGVVCVRFIDDFVIIADTQKRCKAAFHSGASLLKDMGLECANPFDGTTDKAKAEAGNATDGFEFLGYRIEPGLFQPSKKSKKKLLASVDQCLSDGRKSIRHCLRRQNSYARQQRLAQTLEVLDRIVRGWGNSFAYGNSPSTLRDLDRKIDGSISRFRAWYSRETASLNCKQKRRALGVGLLEDLPTKSLDDVPFILTSSGSRFRNSSKTLNVYTDGSVLVSGKKKGKDRGPGGWACVVKETNEAFSGSVSDTTNNRMELFAVIEALKSLPAENTLKIHTDSQYVEQSAKAGNLVSSNIDLWKEFERQRKSRAPISIVWVKGHSGIEFNEKADALAQKAAAKGNPS